MVLAMMLAMALLAVADAYSFECPLLPTRASRALLPGQKRRIPAWDGRAHQVSALASECGGYLCQLLQKADGTMSTECPVLKVVGRKEGASMSYIDVTCTGWAILELPLRPAGGPGHHSSGAVRLVAPCSESGESESIYAKRRSEIEALHASCRALALRAAKLPPIVRAGDEGLRTLAGRTAAEPLDALLLRTQANLQEAQLVACASTDECDLRSFIGGDGRAELAAHEARACDETDAEAQLELLSFAASSLLPPDGRLSALLCSSATERLELAEGWLRLLERRLGAELALKAWRSDSGFSGANARAES